MRDYNNYMGWVLIGVILYSGIAIAYTLKKQSNTREQLYEHCLRDGNKDYECYGYVR